MTRRIHFSGRTAEDNGPAVVNRAYLARCVEWLQGVPAGPGRANTWAFVRRGRSSSGVLVSSTSVHHVVLLLLARAFRRPAWYLAHGVARVEMRINRTGSLKHLWVEAMTIRLATGVVCVSESLRAQLAREFPRSQDRFHAVPNGSDREPQTRAVVAPPPRGVVRLITTGTQPIKNLSNLCSAVVAADLDRVELVVVGPLGAADSWIGDLPFVRHHPRLSHDETLAWMASSDIYLQVSLYETFGLAVCEAAQQGCDLLVATTVGCVPALPSLRDHNLVADPQDTALIASRLRHLVELARAGGTVRHECSRTWDDAAVELRDLLCRT